MSRNVSSKLRMGKELELDGSGGTSSVKMSSTSEGGPPPPPPPPGDDDVDDEDALVTTTRREAAVAGSSSRPRTAELRLRPRRLVAVKDDGDGTDHDDGTLVHARAVVAVVVVVDVRVPVIWGDANVMTNPIVTCYMQKP